MDLNCATCKTLMDEFSKATNAYFGMLSKSEIAQIQHTAHWLRTHAGFEAQGSCPHSHSISGVSAGRENSANELDRLLFEYVGGCAKTAGIRVESRKGAVPTPDCVPAGFPSPLIKPDVPISSIRLSFISVMASLFLPNTIRYQVYH